MYIITRNPGELTNRPLEYWQRNEPVIYFEAETTRRTETRETYTYCANPVGSSRNCIVCSSLSDELEGHAMSIQARITIK